MSTVYRRRAQHAWSSSWIRCVVPSRHRKAESDIPLHNSPASSVRESRLWSAGYDENCCREREPYPRTFSQPQEVPKSLGCTWWCKIRRSAILQQCPLAESRRISWEICCTASSHREFSQRNWSPSCPSGRWQVSGATLRSDRNFRTPK